MGWQRFWYVILRSFQLITELFAKARWDENLPATPLTSGSVANRFLTILLNHTQSILIKNNLILKILE
jgi:hypothetical protein